MFLLSCFRAVEDFLFVPRCVVCRKDGIYLCESHLRDLQTTNGPFRMNDLEVWAPFLYREKIIKKILECFKYKGAKGLGEIMAHRMILPNVVEDIIIIPIPLHVTRHLWRGYNQSFVLAKELCILYNLSISTDLKRTKKTAQQARLNRTDRAKNVENSFVWKGSSLKGKVVFLVDDVCTSGATLKSAAEVLQKAGAKDVFGVVFARG